MLAATALVGLGALTGCSEGPAVKEAASAAPAESTAGAPTSESSSTPMAAGDVREACERFNELWAEYAATTGNAPEAYDEIYLASEEAKETVSGDLRGLFAALSLIAVDHAVVAGSGGQPEQSSKDAVRDAVFANAGACTAEGVTLTL